MHAQPPAALQRGPLQLLDSMMAALGPAAGGAAPRPSVTPMPPQFMDDFATLYETENGNLENIVGPIGNDAQVAAAGSARPCQRACLAGAS